MLDMFENMDPILAPSYELILYLDENVPLPDFKNPAIKVIRINEKFMLENIPMWKKLDKEREIMASPWYCQTFSHRLRYPENSNPKYTLINHAKIDFVNHAMNFTDSQYFCWVDFGYFQLSDRIPKKPLDINLLDRGKINYTLINPLTETDSDLMYTMYNAPERIGGFFFFGSREKMIEYGSLFHQVHDWFQQHCLADDDQHLALRCYYRNPELFCLHNLGGWHRALTHFQLKDAK